MEESSVNWIFQLEDAPPGKETTAAAVPSGPTENEWMRINFIPPTILNALPPVQRQVVQQLTTAAQSRTLAAAILSGNNSSGGSLSSSTNRLAASKEMLNSRICDDCARVHQQSIAAHAKECDKTPESDEKTINSICSLLLLKLNAFEERDDAAVYLIEAFTRATKLEQSAVEAPDAAAMQVDKKTSIFTLAVNAIATAMRGLLAKDKAVPWTLRVTQLESAFLLQQQNPMLNTTTSASSSNNTLLSPGGPSSAESSSASTTNSVASLLASALAPAVQSVKTPLDLLSDIQASIEEEDHQFVPGVVADVVPAPSVLLGVLRRVGCGGASRPAIAHFSAVQCVLTSVCAEADVAMSLLALAFERANHSELSDEKVAMGMMHQIATALRGVMYSSVLGPGRHIWREISGGLTHCVVNNETLRKFVALAMGVELKRVHQWSGREFELQSTFAPHFSLSCLLDPAIRNARYFRTLDLNVNQTSSLHPAIQKLRVHLQVVIQEQVNRMHKLFGALFRDRSISNDTPLNWLSALLDLNELRVAVSQSNDVMSMEMEQMASSESLLINVASMCLRFASPLYTPLLSDSPTTFADSSKRDAVALNYGAVSPRFGKGHFAGLCASPPSDRWPPGDSSDFNFVTECYYMGCRALHVCVAPALRRQRMLVGRAAQLSELAANEGVHGQWQRSLRSTQEAAFALATVLGRDTFMRQSLGMAALQLTWLRERAAPAASLAVSTAPSGPIDQTAIDDVRVLFAWLPDYMVSDPADVLCLFSTLYRSFVTNFSTLFAHLLRAMTELAAQPTIVSRPTNRSRLTAAIGEYSQPRASLAVLLNEHRTRVAAERRLDSALIGALRKDQVLVQTLLPTLMDVYVAAGIVEGLDVDKERFDKYSVRRTISETLVDLWKLPEYIVELRKLGTSMQAVLNGTDTDERTIELSKRFEKFASVALADELHLLEDVLARLANISAIERAMADRSAWQQQPVAVRRQREAHVQGEGNVARSYLVIASSILQLLAIISSECPVVLLRPRSCQQVTSMLIQFYSSLCGPNSSKLKVNEPKEYGFDPRTLLLRLSTITVNVSTHQEFIRCLADDYEYDQSILEDAIKTLRREKIVDQNALHRLQLLQTVVGDMLAPNATPSTPNSAPTAHKAASEPAPLDAESGVFVPEKRMADAKDDQNASKRAKFSAGTDAQATRAEQQPVAPPTSTGALPASLDVVSADDDGGVTRMLDDDGDSHEPIDFAPKATVFSREMMDELNERYVEAMAELRFDAVELHDGNGRFRHHFATNIEGSSSNQRKMERVLKECEALSTSLPLHVGSSVFVRCDEDRMDVMQALITGPADTPYSGGCFAFDLFLPSDYPSVPPLCNLQTTGNGTVRFNPNLYCCGKVCLSLLGTWHGGNDSTAKWNPSHSTIQQVLISIQGLILIEEPYYNEPAYESERQTAQGEKNSREYNEVLRLATARFAMLDVLRHPPPAFVDVVRLHFTLQRERILAQLTQWHAESSESNKAKFARVLREISVELDLLGEHE